MTGAQRIIKYIAIAFGAFLIANIVGAILMMFGVITSINFGEEKSRKNFISTYEEVSSIDLDTSFSNILIQPGDDFKGEATDVSNRFSSKLKNGTLSIQEKKQWFFGSTHSGEIVISIPEDIVLEKLAIDAGAGRVEIHKVIADQLDLSQGAGSLTIVDSDFTKSDIDGGAGKIEISSSILNNLDLDTGIGKVDIEAMITGNSDIDCGVGEIRLRLLGDRDGYQIQAEKGLGSIQIDGNDYSHDVSIGSGNNRIQLEGGVGSIIVEFSTSTTGF